MKALLAKAKSVLAWLWSWVKWADAKFMAVFTPASTWVVSHLAVYKKYYFWMATGAALIIYFFFASISGWFHEMVVAMAPVEHVQSVPEGFVMPVAVVPSALPPAEAPAVDTAPLKSPALGKPFDGIGGPVPTAPVMVPATTVKPVYGARKHHVAKAAPSASPFAN
jgi:hypothetical protein